MRLTQEARERRQPRMSPAGLRRAASCGLLLSAVALGASIGVVGQAATPPAPTAAPRQRTGPTPTDPAAALRAFQERWWPLFAFVVTRMDDIAAELGRSGTDITVAKGTRTELAAAPSDTVSRYIRTYDFGHGTKVTAEIQPAMLINGRITGWPSLRVWAWLAPGGRGFFMVVGHPQTGPQPARVTLHREDGDLPDIPEYEGDVADPRTDARLGAALDAAIRAAYRRASDDAKARP